MPYSPNAAPGWYPQADGTQRYWDGAQWTEHVAPAATYGAPSVPPESQSASGAEGYSAPTMYDYAQTAPIPGQGNGFGSPDLQQTQTYPAMPPQGSDQAQRPWFKKKRIIIPSAVALLIAFVGVMAALTGGDEKPTPVASPSPTVSEDVDPTPEPVAPSEEASEEPTEEPTTAPEPTTEPEPKATESSITTSQREAVRQAESYLSFMPFSRQGLIEQLEYEGFSTEDAEYAVDQVDADWDQQAVDKAESYLSFMAFSKKGLIEQLEYEGFSKSQAEYGVANITVDWMEQAAAKAESYLEYSAFSRSGLIDQLKFEGFTAEEAAHGADSVGL